MNLFFEENGAFKVGTELSSTDSSCQVELPTGKRIKVKKNHIIVTFNSPSPSEFLQQAQQLASEMDLDLLREFAPDEEFEYKSAAKEYFGEASAVEQAATLICLHSNPVYFYRKGRGNYRKAPAETLKLALAAIERKKQQDALKDSYVKQMTEEGKVPEAIASQAIDILIKPDKNSVEYKALKEASDIMSMSPLRLLLNLKAIPNAWRWHVGSFFRTNFPKGRQFPASLSEPKGDLEIELPLAEVEAFSIDDSNTTEVDDAVSVTALEGNRTRVGIHISAPGLGIKHGGDIDLAARERMSTVYAPGLKTTMLPESWIKAYSLDEGKVSPVVSLYAVVDNETYSVLSTETRLEKIKTARNLRYDKIESLVTEKKILSGSLDDVEFGKEIIWLWHFAKSLLAKREEVRGKPELVGRIDWFFDLKGDDENAQIELRGRKRGEPLDLLVAELMIFANRTWGGWLDERNVTGIYRSQRMGKVKLTSIPGPHDGVGVPYYAWSTSPLRRYVDMVNQRQIIATLRGEEPPYKANDSELFIVINSFAANYSLFNDFQSRMDRYWSMRWIEQEGIDKIKVTVVKGDLVRVDGLPMAQRVPGMPEFERGQQLLMQVLELDYIELSMQLRVLEVLENQPEDLDEDELEEVSEVVQNDTNSADDEKSDAKQSD